MPCCWLHKSTQDLSERHSFLIVLHAGYVRGQEVQALTYKSALIRLEYQVGMSDQSSSSHTCLNTCLSPNAAHLKWLLHNIAEWVESYQGSKMGCQQHVNVDSKAISFSQLS